MEDVKKLRQSDKEKLEETLSKQMIKLMDEKLKFSTGTEKDTTKINKLKKDIARIKTVLKEKEVLNVR